MTDLPTEAGPEGPVPAPRKTGRGWFDTIVSLLAIPISVASLYRAIANSHTQRQLLASSSWPFVGSVLSNGFGHDRSIVIGALNSGIGPAKIKTFELFYKHRPVSSGAELLRQCCGLSANPEEAKKQLPGGFSTSLIDETVLRPGQENPVLEFSRSSQPGSVTNELASQLLNISFRVCYCSVLDECWFGDLWTTRTRPVESCPVSEHPFTANGR